MRFRAEVEGLNDCSGLLVYQNPEEAVAQLHTAKAQRAEADLIDKVGAGIVRGGDPVFRQFAGDERGGKEQAALRSLPGQFPSVRVRDHPRPAFPAQLLIGHFDNLIGPRIQASWLFDADRPGLSGGGRLKREHSTESCEEESISQAIHLPGSSKRQSSFWSVMFIAPRTTQNAFKLR